MKRKNELIHVKHPKHSLIQSEHVTIILMERERNVLEIHRRSGVSAMKEAERASSQKVTSQWGAYGSRG